MLGHLVSNVLRESPGRASFRPAAPRLSGLFRRLRIFFLGY
jgi:hypothetical protein